MKRYETPFSACSSTSRLRIAACTDTSSALVGSSQTTSFGSPGEGAGDRDALLEAAGELHRLLRQRALGDPDAIGQVGDPARPPPPR